MSFGGQPLTGHAIPKAYGAIDPTAVFVPVEQILKPEYFPLVTTEVFGPVQVLLWVWRCRGDSVAPHLTGSLMN